MTPRAYRERNGYFSRAPVGRRLEVLLGGDVDFSRMLQKTLATFALSEVTANVHMIL